MTSHRDGDVAGSSIERGIKQSHCLSDSVSGQYGISFPAISTGIFGYPLDAATDVAVNTVREKLAADRRSSASSSRACIEVLGVYRKPGISD